MHYLISQSNDTVKITKSCWSSSWSLTSYICMDLRDVGEECQRIKSHWEASNQRLEPLPDIDNSFG